jgi:glycosyltransferase involved in cell wall biosynthesis
MRILHVGHNDGSHIQNTVNVLPERGHRAQGLCFYWSKLQDYRSIKVYRKWQFLMFYIRFFYEAWEADIVHLWSVQVPLVVWFLKKINKPYFIEWTGSDIRNPGLMPEDYKPCEGESKELSEKRQSQFKDVLNIVSSPVLGEHLLNEYVYIPHRISFSKKLRVAHAPSSRQTKGTEYVLKAVEGLPVEFDLIENVSHAECLARIAMCDVFIDQFVWGEEGMAAKEAMSMGKPVLCWTNHSFPTAVINVAPYAIREKLLEYIDCPRRAVLDGYIAKRWLIKNDPADMLIQLYENEVKKHPYSRFLERRYRVNPELWFIDNYSSCL